MCMFRKGFIIFTKGHAFDKHVCYVNEKEDSKILNHGRSVSTDTGYRSFLRPTTPSQKGTVFVTSVQRCKSKDLLLTSDTLGSAFPLVNP